MQYPPNDDSSTRAEAAAALLAALRDVRNANERLQLAAAWVFEAFGDTADAETIRMLPIGTPARPGRPPVPDVYRDDAGRLRHVGEDDGGAAAARYLRELREGPTSVTGDELGRGEPR